VYKTVDRQGGKKQRTRLAIKTAAIELFAENGYSDTTINDIADRAGVASRTVTLHFPTKEELLFDAEPFALEGLSERLSLRGNDESALDALRDWMATTMTALDVSRGEYDDQFWIQRALRARLITSEPALRGRARAGYYEFEQVLATAIAEDLDATANALIPRVAALTAVTGLRELYESDEARALSPDPAMPDLLKLVDRIIDFARAGLTTATAPQQGDV
jgi:AcrR family transcriptional regulator